MTKLLLLVGLLLLYAISAQASDSATTPRCTVGINCESGAFGLDADQIALHPNPAVQQVYADQSIVFDRRYHRVNATVDIHAAPNAEVVGRLDTGFNFVVPWTTQDGWAQIGTDKWIRTDALSTDVMTSTFAGVRLTGDELPFTVAWLLTHTRAAKSPGRDSASDNPLLLRYTTVYLYDTVEVDGWEWYQIGVNQWVKQTQVAQMLPIERPEDVDTERWFSIDLYEQVLIAYEDETPVYATLVSSGMADWPTNEGLFHVYIRYPRTIMSGAYGQPDFYYLQEVPWTMYFDNDIALHGAYWHDGFGFRRSHGCVNLSVMDAYLMYEWAKPEFDLSVPNDTGPAVYVYSSGMYR
jgi:hypothetical protein